MLGMIWAVPVRRRLLRVMPSVIVSQIVVHLLSIHPVFASPRTQFGIMVLRLQILSAQLGEKRSV